MNPLAKLGITSARLKEIAKEAGYTGSFKNLKKIALEVWGEEMLRSINKTIKEITNHERQKHQRDPH